MGATVTGILYADSNGNGIQEPGEVGIPNATVTLTDGNRSLDLVRTAITDANGLYHFNNVPPGQYTLRVELPAGQGAVKIPPIVVTISDSAPVTLPAAAIRMGGTIYLPALFR